MQVSWWGEGALKRKFQQLAFLGLHCHYLSGTAPKSSSSSASTFHSEGSSHRCPQNSYFVPSDSFLMNLLFWCISGLYLDPKEEKQKQEQD